MSLSDKKIHIIVYGETKKDAKKNCEIETRRKIEKILPILPSTYVISIPSYLADFYNGYTHRLELSRRPGRDWKTETWPLNIIECEKGYMIDIEIKFPLTLYSETEIRPYVEIYELQKENKLIHKEMNELREMIMCMPGVGSEFMKAKEEFETLSEKI